MLPGQLADLLGLLRDELAGVVEVVVDEVLVLDVEEWGEVGEGREEEGQAPGGRDFDEEVGQEGCCEGLWITVVSMGRLT